MTLQRHHGAQQYPYPRSSLAARRVRILDGEYVSGVFLEEPSYEPNSTVDVACAQTLAPVKQFAALEKHERHASCRRIHCQH